MEVDLAEQAQRLQTARKNHSVSNLHQPQQPPQQTNFNNNNYSQNQTNYNHQQHQPTIQNSSFQVPKNHTFTNPPLHQSFALHPQQLQSQYYNQPQIVLNTNFPGNNNVGHRNNNFHNIANDDDEDDDESPRYSLIVLVGFDLCVCVCVRNCT